MAIVTLYGIFMIVCGIVGALVAAYKNRDVSAWAAWAFLLPPSLVVMLFLRRLKGPRPQQSKMDEQDAMLD